MVTHYEVFPERPNDSDLLVSAVEWPLMPGSIPLLMSYGNSAPNNISVPNRNRRGSERGQCKRVAGFDAHRNGLPVAKGASAC
jgi:hypothetical protein